MPSLKEELEFKKKWFNKSTKSAWELFASVLGIKEHPNQMKIQKFTKLTKIWDQFPELQG
jgi:hypothetical protein